MSSTLANQSLNIENQVCMGWFDLAGNCMLCMGVDVLSSDLAYIIFFLIFQLSTPEAFSRKLF